MGYTRGTMGYTQAAIGVHTGYYWGTHGVLWGTHRLLLGYTRATIGVHPGYYGGTQVSRIGAQGGARRGTRMDGCARPLCVGARAAAKARKGCFGYSADRRGYSSGTHDVHHVVRGLFTAAGRGRPLLADSVHTCVVSSVTANAVAAIPTTRAPTAIPTTLSTYAPDGAPPWPLRWASALIWPSIGCALRGHGGSAQPRPWKAPLTVDAVPRVQGARFGPQ